MQETLNTELSNFHPISKTMDNQRNIQRWSLLKTLSKHLNKSSYFLSLSYLNLFGKNTTWRSENYILWANSKAIYSFIDFGHGMRSNIVSCSTGVIVFILYLQDASVLWKEINTYVENYERKMRNDCNANIK